MKPLVLVRDLGSNARDFGSTALDFGSHALDLAWERKKTVLAVVGGIVVVAAAGILISKLLSKRAHARTEQDSTDTEPSDAGKHAKSHGKAGAGSGASMAKAAKL